MKEGVPPLIIKDTLPSLPPLQLTFCIFSIVEIGEGLVIITESVSTHPFPSTTVYLQK